MFLVSREVWSDLVPERPMAPVVLQVTASWGPSLSAEGEGMYLRYWSAVCLAAKPELQRLQVPFPRPSRG